MKYLINIVVALVIIMGCQKENIAPDCEQNIFAISFPVAGDPLTGIESKTLSFTTPILPSDHDVYGVYDGIVVGLLGQNDEYACVVFHTGTLYQIEVIPLDRDNPELYPPFKMVMDGEPINKEICMEESGTWDNTPYDVVGVGGFVLEGCIFSDHGGYHPLRAKKAAFIFNGRIGLQLE